MQNDVTAGLDLCSRPDCKRKPCGYLQRQPQVMVLLCYLITLLSTPVLLLQDVPEITNKSTLLFGNSDFGMI